MPPFGQKQKRQEDKRSAEEIAIESAKNSIYNVCTPMYKAEHIRMHNPITGLDKQFSVNDPAFFDYFYDLSQKGLKDKLFSEIKSFSTDIDSAWENVYSALIGYFTIKDSSEQQDA